jgi:hypothetical protein
MRDERKELVLARDRAPQLCDEALILVCIGCDNDPFRVFSIDISNGMAPFQVLHIFRFGYEAETTLQCVCLSGGQSVAPGSFPTLMFIQKLIA